MLPHLFAIRSSSNTLASWIVNTHILFSIFVHARDNVDRQALVPGSKVSFLYEPDEKGGKAKEVVVEEMAEADGFDEAPRETGTVKVSLTTRDI